MHKFKKYTIAIDDNLNIIKCAKDFQYYTGCSENTNLALIIPPADLMQLQNALFATEPGNITLTCFRLKTSSNTLDWIAANIDKPSSSSEPIRMELSDIQAMKSGTNDTYYDKMTGLYNKNAITEYANDLMQKRSGKSFYFFLMDIDNFKSVNDTFGHMKGDEVITDVAHIARDCVGEKGLVGRIGGDEFMLILETINEEQALRQVLFSIRNTVEEKYKNMGQNVSITVSMGGALFPTDAMDYDSMFMLADKMLYLAKTKGRNRYIIYTPLVHGKVIYDGKVMNISQHMMMDNEKSKLIIELLDKLLVNTSLSFKETFEKVITTYMMDEIYVIDKSTHESTFGIKYIRDENNKACIESSLKISEAIVKEWDGMYDSHPITVIGLELDKEKNPKTAAFMKENDNRVAVVYHMHNSKVPGYVVFINHTQSSCRFSQTDLTDLTYFAHMVELSLR